jgi:hypothetical protein
MERAADFLPALAGSAAITAVSGALASTRHEASIVVSYVTLVDSPDYLNLGTATIQGGDDDRGSEAPIGHVRLDTYPFTLCRQQIHINRWDVSMTRRLRHCGGSGPRTTIWALGIGSF